MAIHQEAIKQAAEMQNAINEFLVANPEFTPTLQHDYAGGIWVMLVARVGRDESKHRLHLADLMEHGTSTGEAN